MLSPSEIRRRLRESAAAVFRADPSALDDTAAWLSSVTARELLRVDHYARRFYPPTLGEPKKWTRAVLRRPGAAVLASMHADGYVRERAVTSLGHDALSDRALAVRVADHVPVVREKATREVLRRRALTQADHIVPPLHRIAGRDRGADVLPRYLDTLIAEHGEAEVWARLRGSVDHDLRRAAFRHSVEAGLLGVSDAVELCRGERDQVVRRQLIRVVADSGDAEVIARVLLRDRAAESRTLALVRLTAAELAAADVERLLVDSSVLVRLWARRRWEEMGHAPAVTYAEITRSNATPAVRARAYTGLAETETALERGEILDLVRSVEPPLRKVGLTMLRGKATAGDVPLLISSMADAHPGVARVAGEVLADSPQWWTLADLASLRTADDPELRRRAWWLHRHRDGWEAVIADLELLHDPALRSTARGRLPDPPMYSQPTEAQRQRIAALLTTAPIPHSHRVAIAFATGLPGRTMRSKA